MRRLYLVKFCRLGWLNLCSLGLAIPLGLADLVLQFGGDGFAIHRKAAHPSCQRAGFAWPVGRGIPTGLMFFRRGIPFASRDALKTVGW